MLALPLHAHFTWITFFTAFTSHKSLLLSCLHITRHFFLPPSHHITFFSWPHVTFSPVFTSHKSLFLLTSCSHHTYHFISFALTYFKHNSSLLIHLRHTYTCTSQIFVIHFKHIYILTISTSFRTFLTHPHSYISNTIISFINLLIITSQTHHFFHWHAYNYLPNTSFHSLTCL